LISHARLLATRQPDLFSLETAVTEEPNRQRLRRQRLWDWLTASACLVGCSVLWIGIDHGWA
jgi:type VI protein secretion system component VasF